MKVSEIKLTDWKSFASSGAIELDQINVIVGRNNSGKSAILHALLMMQREQYPTSFVRIGTGSANVTIKLTGEGLAKSLARCFRSFRVDAADTATLTMIFSGRADGQVVTASPARNLEVFNNSQSLHTAGVGAITQTDTENFIYPYLSKRKVGAFSRAVDRNTTNLVSDTLDNLVAKVDRLAARDYIGEPEYTELCQQVLGFRVGTFASESGKQAGISIGRFDHIPIEEMGEGVSSLLGLITALCMADGHLFLIEEPENDIHPESLKALLEAIIRKSDTNQFIVTTHSNIVTRYLGAAQHSKLFVVEAEFPASQTPTSTIREVESSPEARISILRDLGYELTDFDLWDGWLILEEASAELFVHHFIPWFAPGLARIRTVSASGTSRVVPTFEDYRRLFLFAHLELHYRNRAWVVVDGDQSGVGVVEQLRKTYGDWPQENFRTLAEHDFERYYPATFAEEADAALALKGQAKRDAKNELRAKVHQWCTDNPDEAKVAFAESAAEVISILTEIEAKLRERG